MPIRPAARADLPALLGLVQALARHHGDTPLATLASLDADLFSPQPWAFALVAENYGIFVGYTMILRLAQVQNGARGIDLHHVFVADGHRAQGLGRALVMAALDFGASLGAVYATVTATDGNLAAQEFYRRLGFNDSPRSGARFAASLPFVGLPTAGLPQTRG